MRLPILCPKCVQQELHVDCGPMMQPTVECYNCEITAKEINQIIRKNCIFFNLSDDK